MAVIPLILFLIAFLIRVAGVSKTCMVPDEWLYWTKTNMILANNWVPVLEVFECSPPTYPHVGAFFASFFGSDLNVFRMISVFFGSLTVPMMYLLGKEMFNKRVGMIAAILMCFAPYHCFYSRIYKLEAFTIFLIVTFLYFFWLSEVKGKKIHTILAGIFLGLSIAAKYLPVFLLVAIPAYMFWIYGRREIRKIIKKIILLYFSAFLALIPLILGLIYSGAYLQPLYYYTSGLFEAGISKRTIQYSLVSLIENSLIKIAEIIAYGSVFLGVLDYFTKFTTLFIFVITMVYHLYKSYKRDKQSSLIFGTFFFLIITLLFMRMAKYYLIYTLPLYFLLLSQTVVEFTEKKGSIKFFSSFFLFIFLLNTIFIASLAAFSYSWEEGDGSWVCHTVDFIKRDSSTAVIGTFVFVNEPIKYHAWLNNMSVEVYNLAIPKDYPEEAKAAILRQINLIKPDYIVMIKFEMFFYGTYFKGKLKEEILKDYYLAYTTNSYPYQALILKRKMPVLRNTSETHGNYIDRKFFDKNVPLTLKVVKPYEVRVKIKNVGDKKNLVVRLHSNDFLVYIYHRFQNLTLDHGESRIITYRILPLKKSEDVPLSVDVFVTENGVTKILDTYTKKIKIN